VGAVIADLPSTEAQWQNEKYVMQKVGYKVIYDEAYDESQVDFTQNVISDGRWSQPYSTTSTYRPPSPSPRRPGVKCSPR
jgi:hypothetical protein